MEHNEEVGSVEDRGHWLLETDADFSYKIDSSSEVHSIVTSRDKQSIE